MAIGKTMAAGTRAVHVTGAVERIRRSMSGRHSVLILALIFVFALGMVLSPTFLTMPNLQDIMRNIAILGVVALGQTLVMLLRQIDLSIGALMAFAPIAAIQLAEIIVGLGGGRLIIGTNYVVTGMVLIMVLTITVSVLVGLLNGVLTVKGLVPSLIVTLGMLYALRGAAYLLSGGHPMYLTDLEGFRWLGTAQTFGFLPLTFLIFLAIGVLAITILKYTKVGPMIYSTGGNEKGAIYSGVNTGRWTIIAFVFSGFCAGLAALFFSSRLGSVEPAQAFGYELSAIAIAVVGGTTLQGGRGTMLGTVLAAVILAIVINIITLQGLVIWHQTIIIGLIIITAAFIYWGKERGRPGPKTGEIRAGA
jgi:ribose/xylose/arabinose/galactoside ABC-type transport system permease subunit